MEQRLGMAGAAVTVNVAHRCGHTVRWTFFGQAKTRRQLAALAACARCDGTAPISCDVVWPGTGVCHAHEGRCPDSPHDPFLHSLDARVSRTN